MTPAEDLTRQEIADWISNNVLGDLRTLEVGIKDFEGRKVGGDLPVGMGGGNFLLAVGCLMALEYFSRIYSRRERTVDKTREYIAAFFGVAGERYLGVWDLVWPALRNGVVHGGWPQRVSIEGQEGAVLRIGVGNTMSDPHLQGVPGRAGTFVISAAQLLEDLSRSVESGFRNWILNTAQDSHLARAQPQKRKIRRHRDSEEAQFQRAYQGTLFG